MSEVRALREKKVLACLTALEVLLINDKNLDMGIEADLFEVFVNILGQVPYESAA